tara:strand:- start:870 stop:1460 length:591 start_codon:yes stop_codon:yes gene_type:complete
MSKKSYIQLFLISVFIFISLFLFFKYFKKTGFDNNINANLEQNTNSGESLIEDLKYQSVDKKGNKYEIEAKKGNIDKNNPDIIYLENVRAIILLQNTDLISISSNFAKYNIKNFDTLFNDSILVNYGEHVLKSGFLDLSFESNLVSLYDNVSYRSGISSLKADKAEIDILNKKTKIFMEDSKKKVQINNIPANGNN